LAVGSPDGRSIAIGCEDGSVRFVDVESRQQQTYFQAHEAKIGKIAFDQTGARLATMSRWEVACWDVERKNLIKRIAIPRTDGSRTLDGIHALSVLSFQPRGREERNRLLVRVRRTLTVHDLDGESPPLELESGMAPAGHAAWGPGGELAVGGLDGRLSLLDADLEPKAAFISTEPVSAIRFVAFAPDGNLLATTGDDLCATLWDTRRLTVVGRLDHGDVMLPMSNDSVCHAVFSSDGRMLITVTSAPWIVSHWDVRSGRRLWYHDYSSGNPALLQAAFAAGERCVFVIGNASRVLDAGTGSVLIYLPGAGLGMVPGTNLMFVRQGGGLEVREFLPGWSGPITDRPFADGPFEPRFSFVPFEHGAWRLDEHDR
jgi:WD40 repeat protein